MCVSHSVVSESLRPHGLWPARLPALGILQARTLEWVAISFSRGSFWPRDWTQVSCITGRFFTIYVLLNSYQGSYSLQLLPESVILKTNQQQYWETIVMRDSTSYFNMFSNKMIWIFLVTFRVLYQWIQLNK